MPASSPIEFEAAGVPTGYVDAHTPADERERIGRRLREGQIKVVCNVYCLTTGVDWDVRCIILARPTKSEILYTQIIGRGLRIAEGKTDCLILDHSDSTLRLGFVTDIHHETLDDGKHRQSSAQARQKAPALPKECPSCSYLKPAGVHKCPSCGFVPERQSSIEECDGELVQLNGKRKDQADITDHSRQDVYSMLLWVQRDRGYKPGYAAAKYKARYGNWPRGLLDVADGSGRRIPELAEIAGDRLPQASAEGGPACCMSLSKTVRWAGGAGYSPRSAFRPRHSRTGTAPARSAVARTASDSTTRAAGEHGYVHDAAPATASNW